MSPPSTDLLPVGCTEIRLCGDSKSPQRSSPSVGERILHGESLLMLDSQLLHLITNHEQQRRNLVQACVTFADQTEPSDFETLGRRRLPTLEAANRAAQTNTPCPTPLPEEIDDQVQALFKGVLEYIDKELPFLVTTLFRPDKDANAKTLMELIEADELEFSSREPAINIYRDGGNFDSHEDDQALTVLMNLSDPQHEYTGGGTAFWSHADCQRTTKEPTLVARPPAGSVLLFGGTVTHAGRAVESGCRVVLVASFSRLQGDTQ